MTGPSLDLGTYSLQLQAEADRCTRLSRLAANVTGIGMLSSDFIQP